MSAQFLNKSEDLDWLFSTHLVDYRHLRDDAKSFIIIGNEDAPKSIELYKNKEVQLGEQPILIINLD